jgi:hypothetical protein
MLLKAWTCSKFFVIYSVTLITMLQFYIDGIYSNQLFYNYLIINLFNKGLTGYNLKFNNLFSS